MEVELSLVVCGMRRREPSIYRRRVEECPWNILGIILRIFLHLMPQIDLILASRYNESENPHRLSVWAVGKGWQAKIGPERSPHRVGRPWVVSVGPQILPQSCGPFQ